MLIASSRPTTAQVIAFTTVGPSITARARSANNTLLNSRLSNRSSRIARSMRTCLADWTSMVRP